MATTPPLRSTVRTPPTPLHGAKYDTYQPYTTRKSTRFLTQRAARTPSPDPTPRSQKTNISKSRMPSSIQSAAHTYSPPSSTQTSPQQTAQSNTKIISDTRAVTVIPPEDVVSHKVIPGSSIDPTMMLPTPAKTPRKKTVHSNATAAARVLFPNRPDSLEDAMPTPTKHGRRPKKHIAFSLDSFGDDGEGSSDGKIEIYTDSKDRVPELDGSEDNPFYAQSGTETPSSKRASKRRKVSGGSDHNGEVQEMLKRNEGMVYVFRGKKIYRKFDVDVGDQSPLHGRSTGDTYTLNGQNSTGHSHLTRSSIKPRLLFPTKQQQLAEVDVTDEEAVTDIEDPQAHDSEATEVAAETEAEHVVTPVKSSFTPASPPSTGHATRASTRKAALGSSPTGPSSVTERPRFVVKKGRNPSPFDGWQRAKSAAVAESKGKKRQGDAMERAGEESKKVRGNK
ncbi:hypothetical protein MMC13_002398 [Lambiella insularis]|nr:hypothetical protein [Lambiella insularis]